MENEAGGHLVGEMFSVVQKKVDMVDMDERIVKLLMVVHHWSYAGMVTCLPSSKSDLNGEVEMGEDGKVGEMLLPLGDLGAKVVVTHPGFKNSFSRIDEQRQRLPGEAWEPSGSQKPNCYLLPPGSALNLTLH